MDMQRLPELKLGDKAQPPFYQPQDIPSPTRFPIKWHPQTDKISEELDKLFYEHWPWRSERERELFLTSEINKWGCVALPLAKNDRMLDVVKANTVFILLDDLLEDMDKEEGKALCARLIPVVEGKRLPDRKDPIEWISYDLFTSMRECDPKLTDDIVEGAKVCVNAMVDPDQLQNRDMASLIGHRVKEGGCAFVAATVRFGMDLHMSTEVLGSLQEIHYSYSKTAIILNDIESLDKELRAEQTYGKQESLNLTRMIARDWGVSNAAAKRITYVLIREAELEHERLVAKRLAEPDGCDETLKTYLYALGCVIGGNEAWSQTTARYHQKG